MTENIVDNLKLIYTNKEEYYGEWSLSGDLSYLSIEYKNKKLFNEFLERYYYMPLKVIFKDEALIRGFKYSICSRVENGKRSLYFSKKAFLNNIISNADELMDSCGSDVYKNIKTALRRKKDMYRDCLQNSKKSKYYKELETEYLNSGSKYYRSFEEYLTLCKKKFTRLLSGFNLVLDLFDKPIRTDSFIKCFDKDQLYLLTMHSILKENMKSYELYGKIDYNISYLEQYKKVVNKIRDKEEFYNTHILIDNLIYTVDDLFHEYDNFLENIE